MYSLLKELDVAYECSGQSTDQSNVIRHNPNALNKIRIFQHKFLGYNMYINSIYIYSDKRIRKILPVSTHTFRILREKIDISNSLIKYFFGILICYNNKTKM